MRATENAIETKDLTKIYGKRVRAVDRLNLTIRRGEVYGLPRTERRGQDDHHELFLISFLWPIRQGPSVSVVSFRMSASSSPLAAPTKRIWERKGARAGVASCLRGVLLFVRGGMFDYVLLALLVNTLLRRGLSQTAQISPSERRDRAGYRRAYDLAPRTWPPGHRESTGSETVRPRARRASRASCCVGQG
jgi:hypothetical protein